MPSLKQLIVEENKVEFAEDRWKLLEWALNLDKGFLNALRNLHDAKDYRVVLIALKFLLLVTFFYNMTINWKTILYFLLLLYTFHIKNSMM